MHLQLLLILGEESLDWGVEDVAALEEVELEDEKVASDDTAELLNEVASGLSRSTSSNEIVNNQDSLSWSDGILLHLEEILSVLLLVGGGNTWTWNLALLANWSELASESQSETWAEKEASGIKRNDNVWLGWEAVDDLELEGKEESLLQRWVGEEWEDVDKVNALDWEIWEVTQRSVQSYLCTGEFGGTGGIGGGLGEASRGILLLRGCDEWCCSSGKSRLGHCEREEKR